MLRFIRRSILAAALLLIAGLAMACAEPLQALRDGIAFEEKITTLASKVAEYAMLRQSTDAKDPQAGSQMGRIMGVLSQTAGPEAAFRGWAAKLPQLMELVRRGIRAKDIVTKKSFENAIMVHAAISGSTNATMHIPAIAHEFGIEIDADTFDKFHRGAHYLLNIRSFSNV